MNDDSVKPANSDRIDSMLESLRPPLTYGAPDEPITLYRGPIAFSQAENTAQVEAAISLRWLPSPSIHLDVPIFPGQPQPQSGGFSVEFDANGRGPRGFPLLGEFTIRFDDETDGPRGFITGSTMSISGGVFTSNHTGIINERVIRPADGPVDHVMFLLPNFRQPSGRGVRHPDGSVHAARLILRGGGWIVNLESTADNSDTEKYLKANSGFGITQVGRLEKEDRMTFSAEDAIAALRALGWYISFAAGNWTGPCLPVGFNQNGDQVWQIWDYNRTDPFRQRGSWLSRAHGEQFERPFFEFMRLWMDESWEEVIRLAIHWYVEANAQAGSVEGSIVLTQTAFELLASAVLVDHKAWLSQEGCDKLAAADRIRLLFLWAEIPTGIPDELGDLLTLARSIEGFTLNKVPDAASAMTTIRNTITHPTRKNRERYGKHSHEGRIDAWMLGMRNLELCLLKLFKHEGTYADRISCKWHGEVRPMP